MKKILSLFGIGAIVLLSACAKSVDTQPVDANGQPVMMGAGSPTPTVDYIQNLDVYSAPQKDSFLNQLAMNYRSYAIYNARTVGDNQMGELFAQKAIAAFSGETPFPEDMQNWPIADQSLVFDLQNGCRQLTDALKNDISESCPEVAAEAQAKFDCWLSSTSAGRMATANECQTRFNNAMAAINSGNCGRKVVSGGTPAPAAQPQPAPAVAPVYYPDTANLRSASGQMRSRDGVVIVNNINIPKNLINPVPVPPVVFNQNIVAPNRDGGAPSVVTIPADQPQPAPAPQPIIVQQPAPQVIQETPVIGNQYVTRDEFINMMMAMRRELQAINARMANQPAQVSNEPTVIKVQQIPLTPQQHVMEEVFEVRFDFNKYIIKPEYQKLIQELVAATQANKNVRISVVGHTDTVGTDAYNYALGGRRATAVRNMLIQYGIPSSQITAVSAGEKDLAVQTGDNVRNAANRRVQIMKETRNTVTAPAAAAGPVVTVQKPAPLPVPGGTMYGTVQYDENGNPIQPDVPTVITRTAMTPPPVNVKYAAPTVQYAPAPGVQYNMNVPAAAGPTYVNVPVRKTMAATGDLYVPVDTATGAPVTLK